jgi:hypothetical protein
MRYAQGRLSARRSHAARRTLALTAGAGLAAGVVAGVAIGSRAGAGCAHGHDHDHDHAPDGADLPAASVDDQAAHAGHGALAL